MDAPAFQNAAFLANAVRPSKINAVAALAFHQGLERGPTRGREEWVQRMKEFRGRQGNEANEFRDTATLAAVDLYPGEQEPPPGPEEAAVRARISGHLRVFYGAKIRHLAGDEGFLDHVDVFSAAIGPGFTWESRIVLSGTAKLALSALAHVGLAERLDGVDDFNADVAAEALVSHLRARGWPEYVVSAGNPDRWRSRVLLDF